jgi:hypothetical protein
LYAEGGVGRIDIQAKPTKGKAIARKGEVYRLDRRGSGFFRRAQDRLFDSALERFAQDGGSVWGRRGINTKVGFGARRWDW